MKKTFMEKKVGCLLLALLMAANHARNRRSGDIR